MSEREEYEEAMNSLAVLLPEGPYIGDGGTRIAATIRAYVEHLEAMVDVLAEELTEFDCPAMVLPDYECEDRGDCNETYKPVAVCWHEWATAEAAKRITAKEGAE